MFRKLADPVPAITIFIDGVAVAAEPGESVAAAILRLPHAWARLTPVSKARRAPYCMMGVCFDCLVEIDGIPAVQACLEPIRDGMRIARQTSPRTIGR